MPPNTASEEKLRVSTTPLSGLLLIEPTIFDDSRGSFFEAFNARSFFSHTGVNTHFVQDNQALSNPDVLRGLHYQIKHPQGKLVRAIRGTIWDVSVDIRRDSPTFGQWHGVELSPENALQVWIPPGFAHGYCVRQGPAEIFYKTTDYWMPEHERCILWNDPAIGIDWGSKCTPILSDKDKCGVLLASAEVFE